MKDLNLNFSEVHKSVYDTLDWDKIYKLSYNGFMVVDSQEAPIPWDVAIDVSEDDLSIILSGSVGASGFGTCTCTIPKSHFSDTYTVIIEPIDETAATKLATILQNVDIAITPID
jgi:hypothetical protein